MDHEEENLPGAVQFKESVGLDVRVGVKIFFIKVGLSKKGCFKFHPLK